MQPEANVSRVARCFTKLKEGATLLACYANVASTEPLLCSPISHSASRREASDSLALSRYSELNISTISERLWLSMDAKKRNRMSDSVTTKS